MIGIFWAILAVAAPYPDPIAPAADGKVMCFRPDAARKTCASTGGYTDNGDGTFTNVGTMLISARPVTVVQVRTLATLRDGAVCGAIHAADISAATVTVDGTTLSPEDAQPILDRLLATVFSGIVDYQVCTTYVSRGGQLMSKASLNGQPFGIDAVVKWVAPGDGYRVAP